MGSQYQYQYQDTGTAQQAPGEGGGQGQPYQAPPAGAPRRQSRRRGSRLLAAIIGIVAIVFFTLTAASNGLQDLCWEAEGIYYSGYYNTDRGYYEANLYDLLDDRYESANGMLSVTLSYPELDDVSEAFQEAKNHLYDAYTPHTQYNNNVALQEAFEALDEAVRAAELTERDRELYTDYAEDFSGAGTAIETAAGHYNEAIDELRRELARFPANVLSSVLDVDVPERFA